MKTNLRIAALITMVAVGLSDFNLLATETNTVPDVAGQWRGKSYFNGISYEEATQKKVAAQDIEVMLYIAADGNVKGRIGGAELSGSVKEAHRGWFWRQLRTKTNFLIEGKLVGVVASGSEGGEHPIKIPFIFDGNQISGSVFAVYPIKYPYPFLSVRLNR